MSRTEEELEEELTGEKPRAPQQQSLLAEPAAIPLTLPSKGLLYKNDPRMSAIDKDGQILVRPITLDDLELFMMPELVETGTVIDALFNRIIKTNIDPKHLTVSDRNFIMIYVRAQSYGSEYTFKFNCNNTNCNKVIKKKIDLGELPITYLDEIHNVKKLKEPFSCKLSMSGATVLYNLSRGINESEAAADRYKKRLRKELEAKAKNSYIVKENGRNIMQNVDPFEEGLTDTKLAEEEERDTLYDILSRNVVQISRGKEKYSNRSEVEQVLRNMVGGDVSELQQYMKEADSGIDMDIKVKCPSCKTMNTFVIPFTESFFRREVRRS